MKENQRKEKKWKQLNTRFTKFQIMKYWMISKENLTKYRFGRMFLPITDFTMKSSELFCNITTICIILIFSIFSQSVDSTFIFYTFWI